MKKITRGLVEPFLARYATEGRVLNIGSGIETYRRYFPNQVSVDIDPAKKPDIVGDVHHLPIADESFDMVVCTTVLEHVQDPKQAVAEMRRVLKTGGTLLLTIPFTFPMHGVPTDFWRVTEYGMRELLKDFTITEIEAHGRPFETVAALLQRIMFQTTMHCNKLSKLFMLGLVTLVKNLDFLIAVQYGEIERKTPIDNFMASGYAAIARKDMD
jgi:SAM-dependent methyltransferase